MSAKKDPKNEDQELRKALEELVSKFEAALFDVELPENDAMSDKVRKETKKFLAELLSEQNREETKVVKFDPNDEATFPKQEGSYLVCNGANIGFVCFWSEFAAIKSERNSVNVMRKRRWMADYEVSSYCPVPLSQLCRGI